MIVFQAMWMNTRQYITIEPAEIVSSFSISHKHRGPSAIVIFTSKSIEKKMLIIHQLIQQTVIFEELK